MQTRNQPQTRRKLRQEIEDITFRPVGGSAEYQRLLAEQNARNAQKAALAKATLKGLLLDWWTEFLFGLRKAIFSPKRFRQYVAKRTFEASGRRGYLRFENEPYDPEKCRPKSKTPAAGRDTYNININVNNK